MNNHGSQPLEPRMVLREIRKAFRTGLVKGVNSDDFLKLISRLADDLSTFPSYDTSTNLLRKLLECEDSCRVDSFFSVQQHFSSLLIIEGNSMGAPVSSQGKTPVVAENDEENKKPSSSQIPLATPLTSDQMSRARTIMKHDVVDRFSQLKECYRDGYFHDFRLVEDMMKGLGSDSEEFGKFVSEKVLPGCGERYKDVLSQRITPQGSLADFRAFQSLYFISPDMAVKKGLEIIDQAPNDFKAEIVFYLSREERCRGFVVEWLKSEETPIAHAAIRGLAFSTWSNKSGFFGDLFRNGTAWSGLQWFFEKLKNQTIQDIIWDEVEVSVKNLDLVSSAEPSRECLNRIGDLILCIHPDYLKKEQVWALRNLIDQLYGFYQIQSGKTTPEPGSAKHLVSAIITKLTQTPEIQAKKLLSAMRFEVPLEVFGSYFSVLLEVLSPEELFSKFSRYFEEDSGGEIERRDVLLGYFQECLEFEIENKLPRPSVVNVFWDPSWYVLAGKLINSDDCSLAAMLINSNCEMLRLNLESLAQRTDVRENHFHLALFGLLKSGIDVEGASKMLADHIYQICSIIRESGDESNRPYHRALINLIKLTPFASQEIQKEIKAFSTSLEDPYLTLIQNGCNGQAKI